MVKSVKPNKTTAIKPAETNEIIAMCEPAKVKIKHLSVKPGKPE